MQKYSYRQWLILFVLYNLLFLGLQIAFILSKGGSFINAISLPAPVYLWLFATVFVHLALYFALSILQTGLVWGLVKRGLGQVALERWHISIWSLSVCALLTSNAYFFPLSRFSRLFLPELPHAFLVILMLSALLLLGSLLLNMMFFVGKQYPKILGGFFLLCIGLFIYNDIKPSNHVHPLSVTPNIIVIGVDSLSPRSVNSNDMPTLTNFINEGVVFKEAISPLAHTYPAWTSILTGLYPQHHHARYNLMPPDMVKSSRSIAWNLQRLGYQTIFATDDRQFNNMGKEFGFQKIIGPAVGANDMLLGAFNDFPLSNLLVNLPISRWLFPYNYINRASYFTYHPHSFDKALHNALKSTSNAASPYFIAVHFTLPHWPYAWASSSLEQVNDEYNVEKREQLYLEALKQVDDQVSTFLDSLQKYGYLNNSLVIVLSDHGEALYLPGSRQTKPSAYQGPGTNVFADYLQRKTSTALEMSVGHGSDLLSADQYHCVLAFKIYQHNRVKTVPKIINTRVALIDLAPTIYAFLGMPTQQVDGLSLLNTIQHNATLPERAFVMESGMLPNQFLTREKTRLLAKKFFTIDPHNGQLQLRKDEIATLDAQKLYALIEGEWILALYPDDDGYIPVTLHLNDGKWTDELTTDFAKRSPAMSMFNHLQSFYQKKLLLAERQSR